MHSFQEQINKIKDTFSSKIKFEHLQKIAEKNSDIESTAFYEMIEALTSQWKPSLKDDYESKWIPFYLPVEREGVLILTAVSIFLSYKKIYYVTFTDFSRYGGASVDKGIDKIPKDYRLIFEEISRFIPFIKDFKNKLIEELYPYYWRSGRIRRKYICDTTTLISKEKGENLLAAYKKHLKKNLSITEISLNDFLKTAAICYQAAFAKDIRSLLKQMKVTELSDELLYKRWADNRHGEMLFIKDPDSKKEYMDWYLSRRWEGAHPFEIVYSGNIHGISLYPPDEKEPFYRISIIDPFYNDDFLKMIKALIENNIPFKTFSLEGIVNYCRGESYIDVNTVSMRDETFSYRHTEEEKEKYFSYIEWDKIQMLESYD